MITDAIFHVDWNIEIWSRLEGAADNRRREERERGSDPEWK